MRDEFCGVCGEPWGVTPSGSPIDMSQDWRIKFMRGDGCPCCGGPEQYYDAAYDEWLEQRYA